MSYYFGRASDFDEMIANFTALYKSYNSKENLEYLNYLIGDDLYNLLHDYYTNNLLEKNSSTKKTT